MGQKKHCVCDFQPATNSLGYPYYLTGKLFDPNWSVFWIFMICMYSMANTYVIINYFIVHIGQIVVLCHQLGVSCNFFVEIAGHKVWCVLQLIVYILQPFLMSCVVRYSPPYIDSHFTLGSVYSSS